MPAPATIDDFLAVIHKSKQLDTDRLNAFLDARRQNSSLPPEPKKLAALLVREGLLTTFQAEQFLQGKYKGFRLGGYRILERLGSGGTGTVFLAEHEVMKRRAALKVLPPSMANDPAILERFRREAQAAAVLDHPNIVRAYDFRQEGTVHFLVMEYVEGPSLEDVMQRKGPLSVEIVCEYIRQAAVGLAHAHESGLVHRDVKPGNLLVDPSGVVKLLDLGLARMQVEGQESVTKKFDENMVMGTADYLAPEQALNLHEVDLRADIYSLGATMYALLAGEAPFQSGTVTQKLLWHQMREPKPLTDRRADIPDEVAAIVAQMMAKAPDERYQTCHEVAEALAPFCAGPTPQSAPKLGTKPAAGPPSPYVKATAKLSPSTRQPKDEAYDDLEEVEEPRPKVKPPSTRRHKVAAAPLSPSALKRREREERDEPARREIPNLRKPAQTNSQLAGLMMLGGVMTVILVVVFGVIAFLVWGPQPQATSTTDDDKRDKAKTPVAKQPVAPRPQPQPQPGGPFRLPDLHGLINEMRDGNEAVERVAFASDGKRIAAACADRLVRVWDLEQRKVIHHIAGHSGPVNYVVFNGAGNRVLSASQDGTARLCELPTGRELKTFSTPGKRIWSAQFANNESQVVTAGDDPVIRVWDVNTGQKIREIPGHTDSVNALAIRPRQSQVLSASWDKTLRLWNLNDGKEVRSFAGHTDKIACCASSADEKLIVSGSYDGKVRLYQEDGKSLHTFSDMQGGVWFVAVSPDGSRVLAAGVQQDIVLYDVLKRSRVADRTYGGHRKDVTGLAFSPDGRHFVASSQDGGIRLYGLPPQGR